MDSPLGKLLLCANQYGLESIDFLQYSSSAIHPTFTEETQSPVLNEAKNQLNEYFSGKRKVFSVSLAPSGTEFQHQVWQALLRIPYGTTTSYSQVAQSIKNAKSVRSVGTAVGRNPIPIIIPCHRVILSNGLLGGFRYGTECKTKLLQIEQISAN